MEHDKLEKKKKEYLIREFEKEAKEFVICFKDGKYKNIKGLYTSNEDCLMINYQIDKETVDCLKDNKHQTSIPRIFK